MCSSVKHSGPIRSLNDLRRLDQDRLWDSEPKGLSCLEIDREVKLRGLLDRQIGRVSALENPVDIAAGTPIQIWEVGPIGHEATRLREQPSLRDRRQPMLSREVDDEAYTAACGTLDHSLVSWSGP